MYNKRVDYHVNSSFGEKAFSFTIEKLMKNDYVVEFYGDRKVREGFSYGEYYYGSLYEFLFDLFEDDMGTHLDTRPLDLAEVLGQLLVGEDSLEIEWGDKKVVLERWAEPGRFSLHENGHVSENVKISVGKIKEEDGYLVGSVLVDGGRYPFDYCLETEELEIHHYSATSWIDGRSCVELNLPSVVQRNYDDVAGEIYWALDSFLEKRVDGVIEDAAQRSGAAKDKGYRIKDKEEELANS